MYIIKWDDGETEYYAIKHDILDRMVFLVKVCGYVYGRDFNTTRILDGKEFHITFDGWECAE